MAAAPLVIQRAKAASQETQLGQSGFTLRGWACLPIDGFLRTWGPDSDAEPRGCGARSPESISSFDFSAQPRKHVVQVEQDRWVLMGFGISSGCFSIRSCNARSISGYPTKESYGVSLRQP